MMKLKYTDGCICTSYDVDGTEFLELPIEQQRALAIKLINYTNNVHVFEYLYSFSLEDNDELYNMVENQIRKFYEMIDKQCEDFENNWTNEQKKEYCINYINSYNINSVNTNWLYQTVFEQVLEHEGKYTDLGWCECCGDHIRSYTLEIH